jgi:hypothetical protein
MPVAVPAGPTTSEISDFGRTGSLGMLRTNDTVDPPYPITINTTGGLRTGLCTPTIGIPFTRPERKRRLDTSATSTNE